MNHPHLDQAREWAEEVRHIEAEYGNARQDVLAGARIIESLPDHWIDAEKVAELADDMANWSLPGMPSTTESDCRHLIEIMGGFADRINDLLTPPLPTLADMTNAEREWCQWMQARLEGGTENVVITGLSPMKAWVMWDNGTFDLKAHDEVTPLPDLPRLEWPDSGDAPTVAEQENVAPDQQVNPQVMLDSSLPRPEDVPAREPWIVEIDGDRHLGWRNDPGSRFPWKVTALDNGETYWSSDEEITLVSRLVPEVAP